MGIFVEIVQVEQCLCGNYIQFDTIKAKRVVPIGWFGNYHVDLHNLDEFRSELERLIKERGDDFSFTIYSRNVWESNGKKRINV